MPSVDASLFLFGSNERSCDQNPPSVSYCETDVSLLPGVQSLAMVWPIYFRGSSVGFFPSPLKGSPSFLFIALSTVSLYH